MEYYHNLVTQRSFELLKSLRQKFKFILIGDWAVFLWTKALKSKDIDLAVDFSELEKIRHDYELFKNDRLQKYEVKIQEIDIDIYVYHYSNPGLPAEELVNYSTSKEGFITLVPEALMVLKQTAYEVRQGTPKGEKDKIDILSLLLLPNFDLRVYKKIVDAIREKDLLSKLRQLVSETTEVRELGINPHKFSRISKDLFERFTGQ